MSEEKETLQKVCEDLKLSMNATAQHLAFLQNIGHYAFRKTIQKTDAELDKLIGDQNLNLIQMAREHLLAWKWIVSTGRLPLFNAYRMEVQAELTREIKEEQKAELDEVVTDQLGEAWKEGDEPKEPA